jgi:uncharacterized protein YpmS
MLYFVITGWIEWWNLIFMILLALALMFVLPKFDNVPTG